MRIADSIGKLVGATPFRFFTFTLKPKNETLVQNVTRLLRCWRKVRESSCWKTTQTGGAAFLEVKRGLNSGSWHSHLHVIGKGKFIKNTDLQNAWRKITGDSFIVDIRLCREAEAAVSYCTKYASKPFDPTLLANDSDLDEAMIALKSRRMVSTYGEWRGTPLEQKPDDQDLIPVGPLAALVERANHGDQEATSILEQLKCKANMTVPDTPKSLPFPTDTASRSPSW